MGLNIKGAIKAHGLEVREVARRMGITPTALAQHINGKTYKGCRVPPNPSVDVLQRIADAVGCDISELFELPKNAAPLQLVCPHCGKSIRVELSKGGGA